MRFTRIPLLTGLVITLMLSGVACSQENQGQDFPGLQLELQTIIDEAEAGQMGNLHSLLVYGQGELLAEQYFQGYDQDSLHYQYSVTKSVASILIGIAIDQGFINSVEDKVYDYFPEYGGNFANWTDAKAKMTLQDVLTMSAGFSWDEWTYIYTDERNDANKLIRSNDLIKYMLDLPLSSEPGSRWTYNSGCSILLSGIIQNASGMSTEEFAKAYLFDKLSITDWHWEQGKDGVYNTGWGLHLLPADMLKIGRMVLDSGQWEGEQVVSATWLQESSTNHINSYGYQWWLSDGFFSARGWGGPVIGVIPEKELVVVTTAGDFSNGVGPTDIRIINRLARY